METRYKALLRLTIDPVVPKSAAMFGMAESTVVLEMGDRRPHHDMIMTMIVLRCGGKRS